MNSLKNLQKHFAEQEEVVLTGGVRTVFIVVYLSLMGSVGLAASYLAIDQFLHSDWVFGVGEGIFFGLFGILHLGVLAKLLTRLLRRTYSLRISRQGISMKGMFVPWESVYSFSLRDVTGPKSFSVHALQLTLVPKDWVAQVAWDDGSPLGRKTAASVIEERGITLPTYVLSVRPKTLLKFVTWARREYAGPFPYETDVFSIWEKGRQTGSKM
ncbi:hypothetical protein CKALI_11130 [Corynebacterium kalinowskii]|uniref:Uncharacterized protein n=1 Tax=Corynebacterium kalinowskii TaxID=2675216 RepID=A0A6B8VD02_9CORY|nr:hypothetical protein [Corynebacterium kalinowskii]QGU03072.1 hypothetical protein CKALI_11130 [Corynebacterium kalinowskii]